MCADLQPGVASIGAFGDAPPSLTSGVATAFLRRDYDHRRMAPTRPPGASCSYPSPELGDTPDAAVGEKPPTPPTAATRQGGFRADFSITGCVPPIRLCSWMIWPRLDPSTPLTSDAEPARWHERWSSGDFVCSVSSRTKRRPQWPVIMESESSLLA